MDPLAEPDQPDLPLPRDDTDQLVHTLSATLLPETDTPEELAHRDRAATAEPATGLDPVVASLLPANPDEANLAAQYVAASTQALDCLRLAREHPSDASHVLKCTAQSASMMRQAHRWRTALLRAQAERQRRTSAPATHDTVPAEHRAPAQAADALIEPLTAPAPQPTELPQPNPIAEAERYARLHRKRAALIRRLGHVPHKLNCGPLQPELVHAIVTGSTPVLRALDKNPDRAPAIAA
jgi:hypothetical protein